MPASTAARQVAAGKFWRFRLVFSNAIAVSRSGLRELFLQILHLLRHLRREVGLFMGVVGEIEQFRFGLVTFTALDEFPIADATAPVRGIQERPSREDEELPMLAQRARAKCPDHPSAGHARAGIWRARRKLASSH